MSTSPARLSTTATLARLAGLDVNHNHGQAIDELSALVAEARALLEPPASLAAPTPQVFKTLAAIGRLPELSQDGAWLYFVVGPNCWGKDRDSERAVENCRRNYSKGLGSPGFSCYVYLAPADTRLDGMGYSSTASPHDAIYLGGYKLPGTAHADARTTEARRQEKAGRR